VLIEDHLRDRMLLYQVKEPQATEEISPCERSELTVGEWKQGGKNGEEENRRLQKFCDILVKRKGLKQRVLDS